MAEINQRFGEALLNYLKVKQLNDKTIGKYTEFFEKFSNINRDLNQRTIDIFLEHNKSSPPRAMLRSLIKAIIRGDFPQEIKGEVSLFDIAKITSKKEKSIPKFMKKSDIDRLDIGINTGNWFFDERIRLMILVQFYAGLRVSELLGLTYSDLNKSVYDAHENDKYQIIKISSESAKFGKERESYIPTEIYKRLLKWIKEKTISKENKGITVEKENPIWDIGEQRYKDLLYKWSKKILGESYNTHSLRHGRGTNLIIDEHKPIEFVKKYLGHKDIKSTQVYTHISNKDIKNELEKPNL
jgi:integrase